MKKNQLRSRGIRLRAVTVKDAKHIYLNYKKSHASYMITPVYPGLKEVKEYLSKMIAEQTKGNLIYFVTEKIRTEEFLGCLWLSNLKSGYPGIGIWVKEEAQGKGYAKEAVFLIKKWAKKNTLAHSIRYSCQENNKISRKLAKQSGGIYVASYGFIKPGNKKVILREYRIKL